MRISDLVIGVIIALPVSAGNPDYCTGALANLLSKLEVKGSLKSPSGIETDENYTIKDPRNLCIARTDKEYNWIVHKHKDGVTILIQRYEFKTTSSLYYGPFKSGYDK